MYLLYLDNCVFNRRFDDQSSDRVRNETAAVLRILAEIESPSLSLAWSYVNEAENSFNPYEEGRLAISKWKYIATIEIGESERIINDAAVLVNTELKSKDALHLAAAVAAKADFFLTTDDKILKRVSDFENGIVLAPISFAAKLDEYEN